MDAEVQAEEEVHMEVHMEELHIEAHVLVEVQLQVHVQVHVGMDVLEEVEVHREVGVRGLADVHSLRASLLLPPEPSLKNETAGGPP